MTENAQDELLVKLSDAGLTVSDPSADIRGRKVIDEHGDAIGDVSALFIDKGERKVRMLQVDAGGFLGLGERHFLIPAEAVAGVTRNEVRIKQTREHVTNSPAYEPNLIEVRNGDYWEPYYGYYGYEPYWGGGPMKRGVGFPLL